MGHQPILQARQRPRPRFPRLLLQVVLNLLPNFPPDPRAGRYTVGMEDAREPLWGQLGLKNCGGDESNNETIKLGELIQDYG